MRIVVRSGPPVSELLSLSGDDGRIREWVDRDHERTAVWGALGGVSVSEPTLGPLLAGTVVCSGATTLHPTGASAASLIGAAAP